ncbi:MAG TPA: S8 family serine peptidase [Trueperaceae bacterium]
MKLMKPLLALVVISVALTGCQLLIPDTDRPGLIVGTVDMPGELDEQVQLRATGYWQLESDAPWLRATPTSGFGDATVHLSVDPSALEPGSYSAMLSVTPYGGSREYLRVIFSFPRLRGSIVPGPAPASRNLSTLSTAAIPTGAGRLLVGLQPTQNGAGTASASERRAMAADIAAQGGARLRSILPLGNVALVEASNMRGAAERLARDPRVSYVEPDQELELLTSDPLWDSQWAPQKLNAEEAWTTADGTDIRIAILDNGLYPGHPDLDGKVVSFRNLVDDPTSNCGTHGTHVAGIAAAETDNGTGVAGIAPAAGLVLYNVGFESNGACVVSTFTAAEAIDLIVASSEAEVINMSFGGPYTSTTLEDAIERAYAAGITMVASAGNDPAGPVLYPAAHPEVIAVSATNVYDDRASYSAYGPEIFVSAPGGDGYAQIWSTAHDGTSYGYQQMSGTSMASPAVAAAAALVLSVDRTLSPFQVSAILAETSVDLGSPGRDDEFGYGRIDAAAAVRAAADPSAYPRWFKLRSPSGDFPVPAEEQFVAGYVAPGMLLEVGSDDNGNGDLRDSGEYYDSLMVQDPFGSEYYVAEFYVEQQP